jgi:hypothetical protein
VETFSSTHRSTMFSIYPARFQALAASLDTSYPQARIHFKEDYSSLSQNCAQQGRSLVLLNEHLSSLGSLEGIQDIIQFNIPERITNINNEYRAAFRLADTARDAELSSLHAFEDETMETVKTLLQSANARSTNIETYLLQLDGDMKMFNKNLASANAMAQETYADKASFDALPQELTKPLYEAIGEAVQLLEEVAGVANNHYQFITHHRELISYAILSLTLHPSLALHRRGHYNQLVIQNIRPKGDINTPRNYYSPNLHLLEIANDRQIANARAEATAFDMNGNRATAPPVPLGIFHLFPPPFLCMNPYTLKNGIDQIRPDNPAFDFLAIKERLGTAYSHRPSGTKDYPVRIVWSGWDPAIYSQNLIQRTLYSLELEMHESAVFPPPKRRDTTSPGICHIVYTKMSSLLWECIAAGGGFIRGIPLSCKVAVGTGDKTLGKYHYWGKLSESTSHLHPITFMAHAEKAILATLHIHVKICPQQLTPNWLASCCYHGRFDLVFQSPRAAEKYVRYAAHPITPEVMTGFGNLIESAVLSGEIKLHEDMGPFQLELISLPPSTTEGTITRYLNSMGLDFCGLSKRATKTRTNTWTIGFTDNMPDRLDAANALGNKLVPHLSRTPLRVNVKQRNIPRGACIICYHENNTRLRTSHSYKSCTNRDNVCRYCHAAQHSAERCPYVLSSQYQEPAAREPTPRPIATPRFHSVQSPEARAAVALDRRSLASAKARGKKAFSDDEEPSDGENETEPPLPAFRQPAAAVAATYDSCPSRTPNLTGPLTSHNSVQWGSTMSPSWNQTRPHAARQILAFPANTPLHPSPRHNPGSTKRSTAAAASTSSKKPRPDEQGKVDEAVDVDDDLN